MAQASDRNSSTAHRSWRQPAAKRKSPSSTNSQRWLMTLLVGLLLVTFVYLLWPGARGDRHLVAIPIWATDQLAVEPIPYAREDIDALRQLPDVALYDSTAFQDSHSFAKLASYLQNLVQHEKDVLILYLVAHGASEGEEAYLVCSDYLRTPGSGRYPVEQLLQDVASADAALKLLVLDSGRIGSDPRLAMVVNEFPRLVEQRLQQLDQQPLWVLLPNSPLQTTSAAHGQRRSIFGISVAEALNGAADQPQAGGNNDQRVCLAELYEYVLRRCGDWFADTPGGMQAPVLMQAGVGTVAPGQLPQGDPAYQLVRLARKPRDLQQGPADSGDSTDSTDNTEEPPADQRDQAELVEALRNGLLQTWRLRDELQSRTATAGWSPVDFAPHLWRELNATLLAFEQRWRSGRPVDSEDPAGRQPSRHFQLLVQDLEQIGEDLDHLKQCLVQGTLPGRRQGASSVGTRLLDAWRNFLNDPQGAKESFDQVSDPTLLQIRDAVRDYHDLLALAPDYVRWHDHASLMAHDPLPQYPLLTRWLDELNDFHGSLNRLENQAIQPGDKDQVTELLRRRDSLVQLERTLSRRLQQDEEAALRQIQQPISQRRIEDLLSTARLAASRRMHLSDQLLASDGQPEQTGFSTARRPPPPASGVSSGQRQRLLERLRLHQQLVRLVDPVVADQIQSQAEQIGRPGDEEQFWTLGRGLGQQLQTFYAGLPGQLRQLAEQPPDELVAEGLTAGVGDATQQPQISPGRLGHRMLSLIDPRDARRVIPHYPFAEFRLRMEIPLQVALEGPSELLLDLQSAKPLHIELHATQQELVDLALELDYDEQLVQVRPVSRQEARATADGWYGSKLSFEVQARRDQEAAGVQETRLTLTATWSDGEQMHERRHAIGLILPRPDRVDLEIVRVGTGQVLGDQGTPFDLPLYPNRTTGHRFAVVNRSGQPKQVEVALYAIPPPTRSQVAPGRIDAEIRRATYDQQAGIVNARLLAQTAQPLDLPAEDSQRVYVEWAPPGAAPEEGQSSADAAPGAGGPDSPPEPGSPDVSHGLLCVIREPEKPQSPWVKWIELGPLSPSSYLDAQIAYDARQQRIVARLRPKEVDSQGRPILPSGDPVRVAWQVAGEAIPPDSERQLHGELEPDMELLELYAVVPPDGRDRVVRLAVDGYPRAFISRVACQPPMAGRALQPGSDLRRTAREIRITRLFVPGYGRIFHFPPHEPGPVPPAVAEATQQEEPQQVLLERQQPAIFPAPAETMGVQFQADAPVDAFRNPGDRIEITLGDSPAGPRAFYADRRMAVQLAQAGPQGLVELKTQVDDYTIEIPPGGLVNKVTSIQAELVLVGIEGASDHVRLVLDAEQPVIQRMDLPRTIRAGTAASVHIFVRDLSGVESVEFALVPGSLTMADRMWAQAWAKAEPQRLLVDATSRDGLHGFELPLETSELEPGDYLLLARVQDKAGHSSTVHGQPMRVEAPPPKPQPAPQAARGIIRGAVRFAGRAAVNPRLFSVTIEGPEIGSQQVPLQRDGTFLVRNLVPGNYTIKARGSYQNKVAEGELEGIQPAPPAAAKPVVVPVTHN